MEIGIVGLGRMGRSITRRLLRDGHDCVIYDSATESVATLVAVGAASSTSLKDFVANLSRPRSIWVMVPAGATASVLAELLPLLQPGDVVVDGGNSNYRDTRRRADLFEKHGVYLLDVGTSGGVHGLERGFCLMIGGPTSAVAQLQPIFRSLCPGVGAARRTASRRDKATEAEQGYLHCGRSGSGHFAKMVHNAIEYGQMASLAEGLAILKGAGVGNRLRDNDAETAPLANSEDYAFDFDIAAITELWRRGSVIESWLLDLTAEALDLDPKLDTYSGYVSDSGEGRWAVQAAIDEGVPAYVLSAALYERFSSRNEGAFSDKLLSAMRLAFGGHHEKA